MDFEKQFEKLSAEKLIKIIHNQNDYDPLAIQAAEKEISKRELTTEQFSEIQTKVQQEEAANNEATFSLEMLKNLLKNIASTFLRFLNPRAEKSLEDIVEGIATFIVLIAFYKIYGIFDSIYFEGQFYFDRVGFYEIQNWVISVAIPMVGGYLLWEEKQSGWLICSAYLLHTFIVEATSLIIKYKANLFFDDGTDYAELILWLISGWLLYKLWQKEVRNFLSVETSTAFLVLACIFAYSIWQSASLYLHMSSYFS